MGRSIEQQYTKFESNFLCSGFFLYVPNFEWWSSTLFETLKILTCHYIVYRVKVMGNKGEDTGKMGVTNK